MYDALNRSAFQRNTAKIKPTISPTQKLHLFTNPKRNYNDNDWWDMQLTKVVNPPISKRAWIKAGGATSLPLLTLMASQPHISVFLQAWFWFWTCIIVHVRCWPQPFEFNPHVFPWHSQL